MTKTVTLTDLQIDQIFINVIPQTVTVRYSLVDANKKVWDTGEATFFVTMPPQVPFYDEHGNITGYQPVPPNWFQLPPTYLAMLAQLVTDADAALTSIFLV